MRTINREGKTVKSPNLKKGYTIDWKVIKKNATPIDDVEKFVWDEDDYEDVKLYIPYEDGEKEQLELDELHSDLDSTDYIAAKVVDSLLDCESAEDILSVLATFKKEYADVQKTRSTAREKINKLESSKA